MDANYFKSAQVIYNQIEDLDIQLAGINEQMRYRKRSKTTVKPRWVLKLEGISEVELDLDDELVQIICSYLTEKRDKLNEKFQLI